MKILVGVSMGLAIGSLCRYFGIPLPAPPNIFGALLILFVTMGFQLAQYLFP